MDSQKKSSLKNQLYHRGAKVVQIAVVSRLLAAACQICAGAVIDDYDTSSECVETISKPLDGIAKAFLSGFARWDAVYFVRIAMAGYEYEQFHAFFPGMPLAMRLISRSLLYPVHPILSEYWSVVLSGVLLVNGCFVAAAYILYRLTFVLSGDMELSYRAAILFSCNPASVFMTSVYTESPFALCTFTGLYCLAQGHTLMCGLFFAFASSIRGNGVVNIGFLLHAGFQETYARGWWGCLGVEQDTHTCDTLTPDSKVANEIFDYSANSSAIRKRSHHHDDVHVFSKPSQIPKYLHLGKTESTYTTSQANLTHVVMSCGIAATPFLLFQYYGYIRHCVLGGKDRELVWPASVFVRYIMHDDLIVDRLEPTSLYCTQQSPLFLYSFVQKQYWHIGLFAFWEVKQLPNFLLALPMFVLSLYLVVKYTQRSIYGRAITTPTRADKHMTTNTATQSNPNPHPKSNLSTRWAVNRLIDFVLRKCVRFNPDSVFNVSTTSSLEGVNLSAICVYVIHLISMLIFATCFMYVQCMTRFVAASTPVIYIMGAQTRASMNLWLLYGLTFTMLGACMFPNFYPWS